MAFTFVPVVGSYVDSTGLPARGTVSFTPTSVMRNGSSTSRGTVTYTLDETGALPDDAELAATTDPSTAPTGVTYRVEEAILPNAAGAYLTSGVEVTYYIPVSHLATSIDLAVEATDATPDEPALYQRVVQRGAANGYAPLDSAARVPLANLPTAALPVSTATQAAIDAVTLASRPDVDTAGAAVGQVLAVAEVSGGAASAFGLIARFVPPDAEKARYVSPEGSDASDGKTWGTALATIAAAEAAVPVGGVIYLAAGVHGLPPAALTRARALVGPSRRVCTLVVPVGATGAALELTNDGAFACGFTIDASAASATLTSAIRLGPGQLLDDIVISNAPIAIDGVQCGSSRIGTRETVEIYNHTGYAIDIDGNGGLEVTFGKITITRTAAGHADGGIRVSRSSPADVGGIYLDAVVITAGSGTYGIGLDVESTLPDTRTPVRIGSLVVIDAAGTHSLRATNINLLAVAAGCWMNVAPGGEKWAVKLTGCGAPHFVGAYIVGTPLGGAFDISGGTNPGIWDCIADNGALIKVYPADPPVGIQWGGNRGFATLTNDAATLVGAVNVASYSGMRVLTSGSAGAGVLALDNAEGGAAKHLRVTPDGDLQILNGDFSQVLLTVKENNQIATDADMHQGGSFTHYGDWFGVFGTAGTRTTVTPTDLAGVVSILQRHGFCP